MVNKTNVQGNSHRQKAVAVSPTRWPQLLSTFSLIKEVVEKSGGPSLSDADVIAYLTHGDLDRILKRK
ncbi:hypothetical protein ES703_00789 [subsurface metagenome]